MFKSHANEKSKTANPEIKVERSRLALLGVLAAATTGSACSETGEITGKDLANIEINDNPDKIVSGSFVLDGITYDISKNTKTGQVLYGAGSKHSSGNTKTSGHGPISEKEYYAARAKYNALNKKMKTDTVQLSVDTPMGGDGGGGGD